MHRKNQQPQTGSGSGPQTRLANRKISHILRCGGGGIRLPQAGGGSGGCATMMTTMMMTSISLSHHNATRSHGRAPPPSHPPPPADRTSPNVWPTNQLCKHLPPPPHTRMEYVGGCCRHGNNQYNVMSDCATHAHRNTRPPVKTNLRRTYASARTHVRTLCARTFFSRVSKKRTHARTKKSRDRHNNTSGILCASAAAVRTGHVSECLRACVWRACVWVTESMEGLVFIFGT